MTDRCEPPEHLRGVDGWHYIGRESEQPSPALWEAADGWWTNIRHDYKADKMTALGYRYLSPVLLPAEADALLAERDAAVALLDLPEHNMAQRIYHLQESMKFLANIARTFGFANRNQETNPELIGRALREQSAELATLRAEVARLREVIREALHGAEARAAQISAPEDDEIALLCERVGYGAVMDAAMRLWMRKDPTGAFIIGGCAGSYRAAQEPMP